MTSDEASADSPQLGAAGRPVRPIEETERLGQDIYQRDIKAQVIADHLGEVVAIDVETGGWAIAKSVIAATGLLKEQQPDANDVWLERVGYRGLYRLGSRSTRVAE